MSKAVSHSTDAELRYTIADCAQAISAYPESPNTERYLAELRAAQTELTRRNIIRTERKMLSRWPVDWTAIGRRGPTPRFRWSIRNNEWNASRYIEAYQASFRLHFPV